MSQPIIEIKGISKKYRIQHTERYLALRDVLSRGFKQPFELLMGKRHLDSVQEDFFALRDVTLNINPGEVVGIIGRNGAGKTTLLKLISRITYPTSGEIHLRGRVASLLEVGTGFHPELTGRENIFFNGSILGMTKKEIERKFDEIVAFSGVEKFIDTPVKRYSSGMQVRLAFAVAAHLESEILLIDEVLAVGDLEFQKKCLGKMDSVAKGGRTILFVSHNMSAVQRLCNRAVLLNNGQSVLDGAVNYVTNDYMRFGLEQAGERSWPDIMTASGDDIVRLKSVRLVDGEKNVRDEFSIHEPIAVEIEYHVLKAGYPLNTLCYFLDESGMTKFVSIDNLDSPWKDTPRPIGSYRSVCHIPGGFLNEGTIRMHVIVKTSPYQMHACERDVLIFRVIDDLDPKGVRGNYPREWPEASVRPRLRWVVEFTETIMDVKNYA